MNPFSNTSLIAPSKKELPGSLLCWIAYLVGIPLLLGQLPYFQEDSLRTQFLYNLSVSVCCFSLILLVFRDFLFRSRMPLSLFLFACFFGFLAVYGINNLMSYVLLILLQFLPIEPENMNQIAVESFLQTYRLPMILNVVILSPVIEEVLFRGTIFGPLCKKNRILAYAASMAAFSAMHVVSYIGAQPLPVLLISFVEYLPAGFALCWCYQFYGSIWVPITIHGLMNLISSLLVM